MRNIRPENLGRAFILILALLFLMPFNSYAQGNYVWLYQVEPQILEQDLLTQLDFLVRSEESFVVLIDLSEAYKKRILYLLGQYQKEEKFLIAVSNTPKYDSLFIKRELFQYFQVNLIFDEREDRLWFLSDIGKKYRIIPLEEDISQIIDTITNTENYAYIAKSDAWSTGNIANISQYIKERQLGTRVKLPQVKLVMFNQADSLRWFNTLGRFVMSFYFLVLIIFVVFMTLFRSWSKRRIRKKESG